VRWNFFWAYACMHTCIFLHDSNKSSTSDKEFRRRREGLARDYVRRHLRTLTFQDGKILSRPSRFGGTLEELPAGRVYYGTACISIKLLRFTAARKAKDTRICICCVVQIEQRATPILARTIPAFFFLAVKHTRLRRL